MVEQYILKKHIEKGISGIFEIMNEFEFEDNVNRAESVEQLINWWNSTEDYALQHRVYN